jgi:predicted phosphate transport protein (TIGR00153 family)
VLRDLKRIHSHICSVAYPVLEAAGELRPNRLRDSESAVIAAAATALLTGPRQCRVCGLLLLRFVFGLVALTQCEALMLGWFRALMPKEERFFELFARHAQVTLAGAEALRGLLNGGEDVLRHCNEISSRENEADEITREVLMALRRTFITPLDRGDIKDLITSMDDAIDQMNKTAKVIRLFEIRKFEPPMQEMGEVIVRAANISMEAVPLLRSIGKQSSRLNVLTEQMIRLEEHADELHDQGRKELFLKQTNAIGFIIGTEVYDHLERVVDRFEDVANEISAIVIENV